MICYYYYHYDVYQNCRRTWWTHWRSRYGILTTPKTWDSSNTFGSSEPFNHLPPVNSIRGELCKWISTQWTTLYRTGTIMLYSHIFIVMAGAAAGLCTINIKYYYIFINAFEAVFHYHRIRGVNRVINKLP